MQEWKLKMPKEEQVKNIIAFLAILFGKSKLWHQEIMHYSPDYLIEKFDRYILSTRDESNWGLHPLLRRSVLEPYCKKHKIPITHDEYLEIG